MEDRRFEFLDENIDFDYIIDTYKTLDFTEFVVSRGGDVCTYRVYDRNGNMYITER